MKQSLAPLVIACTALLAVAAKPAAAQAPAPAPSTAAAAAEGPRQLRGFPRDRLAIERRDGRDEFRIWLADTPERQQQGLMFVRELDADAGMLFPLPVEREMAMWMKNTLIPLDMLFIGSDGRISHIAAGTTPQSLEIISPGRPVRGVLELKGGEAARRGIRVGDRVLHPHFRTSR